MNRRLLLALPLMLLVLAYCGGEEPAEVETGDAELAARIERVENGLLPAVVTKEGEPESFNIEERLEFLKVPGVSVAVIKDFEIEWARGYGVIEVGGKAVDTETLFQAASISKPVAAMAAMTLVEEGKLDLDADVNTMLTSWTLPDNEFTADEKVTLRRIFSHNAGLTVSGFPGYAADAEWPTLQQVLDGEEPANTAAIPVDVLPGSIWRYSGGGYTIAQQLMIDVEGKPFPQIMQERVLEPLGMIRSTYEQPLPEELADNATRAYRGDGEMVAGRWHSYPEMAAAGLWTTPSDLARFAIEIMKTKKGESENVVSLASVEEMLTKQTDNHGIGPSLGGEGEWISFGHGGGNEGFRCFLYAYTDKGMGVAVMTNGDNGGMLMNEILRAVAAEYEWPDFKPKEVEAAEVDADSLTRFVGRYQVTPNYAFIISIEEGELLLDEETGSLRSMIPLSDTRFIETVEGAEIEFQLDEEGNVIGAVIHFRGQEHPAEKTE